MGFTKFGFSDPIMQGIRSAGFTVPTPVQTLAIPPAMAGRDIIGGAQTGTGKTAAFVLPLLQRLSASSGSHPSGGHPRALILTPTRELAQQVQSAVATYGSALPLRAVAIYGGASMDKQLKALRRGAEIVVATPGRLLDHLQRRTVSLSRVEVLVLDEADRMLDMGFIHDVRKIIGHVPADRQTMLFSATISGEIIALAKGVLRDPHVVEIGGKRNPLETINERFYSVPREAKMSLLLHSLGDKGMQSALVFSRTKHGADKICRNLERKGIASVAIHSNRSQSQRDRALEGFKEGRFRVLVATDIAARGIDVTGISHVFNYDIPAYAEDYVHRIGRTGRAGATGEAITFVSRDESQQVRKIEQFTGKPITVHESPVGLPGDAPSSTQHHSPPHNRPSGHPAGKTSHAGRRRKPVPAPAHRKKGSPKKMESFSSDRDTSWSNY